MFAPPLSDAVKSEFTHSQRSLLSGLRLWSCASGYTFAPFQALLVLVADGWHLAKQCFAYWSSPICYKIARLRRAGMHSKRTLKSWQLQETHDSWTLPEPRLRLLPVRPDIANPFAICMLKLVVCPPHDASFTQKSVSRDLEKPPINSPQPMVPYSFLERIVEHVSNYRSSASHQ